MALSYTRIMKFIYYFYISMKNLKMWFTKIYSGILRFTWLSLGKGEFLKQLHPPRFLGNFKKWGTKPPLFLQKVGICVNHFRTYLDNKAWQDSLEFITVGNYG